MGFHTPLHPSWMRTARLRGWKKMFAFASDFSSLSPEQNGVLKTMGDANVESRLGALVSRIETTQTAFEGSLLEQSTLLRLFMDKLDLLLASQSKDDDNGPTIQELLAEIVLRLGESTSLLRKLDRHISRTEGSDGDHGHRTENGSSAAINMAVEEDRK
jgi:hypothetical protein